MINEAKSAGLSQSLGLLLRNFKQVAAGIFFYAQRWVSDFVHIAGDS